MEEYTPTESEKQEYLAYDSKEAFFDNLEKGLQSITEYQLKKTKEKVVLIAGAMAVFDKGTIDFLNKMARVDSRAQYILLSEVTAEFRRKTKDRFEFESICTPHLLAKEILVPYMDVPVLAHVGKYLDAHSYLMKAIDNLKGRHYNIGCGYAENLIYYADRYLKTVLDRIRPDYVILWNEFYAFHMVFQSICHMREIPVFYMEFGCIPGTFVIEKYGQQGESYPSRHPFKFRRLCVEQSEEIQTEHILAYLSDTGMNRNRQPLPGNMGPYLKRCRTGRPVITYMGQNDYESGIYPYTCMTRKYHSPVFRSTLEALEFLRLLSVKNDWNLLFKPHPIMELFSMQKDGIYGYEPLKDVNINEVIDCSDVIVTILSQSAYLSLIRNTPVVMLGYIQLKGAGCAYEAYSRWKIEHMIRRALKYGCTNRQKKRFLEHTARLLKYCLYDDESHPELPFGQKISNFKGVEL